MKIRVYYEDTDLGGVVYHSNYLKFCERARSEVLFEKSLTPFDESKGGFVVKNLNAKFIAPAKLGDILSVKTQLLEMKRASLRLKQRIFLNQKMIFEMDTLLVYTKESKIAKIPIEFRKIFETIA